MNNNSQDLEKIDLVSDFIDYLNIEKKPKVDDENSEDLEMFQMFETIRAVKRLKEDDEQVVNESKVKSTGLRGIISIKKFAAAAAIFLVAITSLRALNPSSPLMDKKSDEQMNTMLIPENRVAKDQNSESAVDSKLSESSIDESIDNQRNTMLASDNSNAEKFSPSSMDKKLDKRNNKVLVPEDNLTEKQNSEKAVALNPSQPLIDTKPEEEISAMLVPENKIMDKQNLKDNGTMVVSDDIVHAMEKAYEGITGYSGIIEIQSLDEKGKVDLLETIEMKYEKPNKYYFVQKYGDQTVTRISDGEKLYTIDSNSVTIDYESPEKEILRFSIEKKIQELKKAVQVRQIGEEVLLGRETLMYGFRFSNNEPLNKIWVDKSTNLPLKQELNMPNGKKIINQFMQIEVNPSFEDYMFNYKIKEGERVKYENKE